MKRDTTDQPDKLYRCLDEKCYKPEFALLDRYHAFSAELLRLSLLGIAVFGFLFKETFLKIQWSKATCAVLVSRYAALISILFLALASACALFQRLLSTDAARHFIYGLRLHTIDSPGPKPEIDKDDASERDDWLSRRCRFLIWSLNLKIFAVIFLGLGAVGLGVTFLLLLSVDIPIIHDAAR